MIRFGTRPDDPMGWLAQGLGQDRPKTLSAREKACQLGRTYKQAAGLGLTLASLGVVLGIGMTRYYHQLPYADAPWMRWMVGALYVYAYGWGIHAWRRSRHIQASLEFSRLTMPEQERSAVSTQAQTYLATVRTGEVPLMAGDVARLAALNGFHAR